MINRVVDRILLLFTLSEILTMGWIFIGAWSLRRVENSVSLSLYHAADNQWTGHLWKWHPSTHSPFSIEVTCVAYMGMEKAEVLRWHMLGTRIFSANGRTAVVSGVPLVGELQERGR